MHPTTKAQLKYTRLHRRTPPFKIDLLIAHALLVLPAILRLSFETSHRVPRLQTSRRGTISFYNVLQGIPCKYPCSPILLEWGLQQWKSICHMKLAKLDATRQVELPIFVGSRRQIKGPVRPRKHQDPCSRIWYIVCRTYIVV